MTKDNNKLGQFSLEGIPPMSRGQPQIEITYDIDANGILNVSAVEKSTGKENKIVITNDKGRLSKEDIDRMVREAEEYKVQDESNRERIESKNILETYIYSIKSSVSSEECKLSVEDKTILNELVKDSLQWIENNSSSTKEDYENKKKDIEDIFSSMSGTSSSPSSNSEQNVSPFPITPQNNIKIDEVD